MILIGSHAIRRWFSDFPREPKDKDYITCEYKNYNLTKGAERTEYLRNKVLSDIYPDDRQEYVLTPDQLVTLKASHVVGWDINWPKHMWDLQFLLNKGAKIDKDLFHKLYEYWNTTHEPNRRSDLEMNAEDFFNNALSTEYDHDYLHTLLNPIPTYTKVLKDGAEVEVSEEKFQFLSFEDKEKLVREEVELMAWERFRHLGVSHAYSKMLKKFIISHAPLWEALWIVENFILLHKPNRNYIKIINDGLEKHQSGTRKSRAYQESV